MNAVNEQNPRLDGAEASGIGGWHHRYPSVPIVLAIVLVMFMLVPPARENPRLEWTFFGVSAVLLAWSMVLSALALRDGRVFAIEYSAVKAHYVQALVQTGILIYWGLYWTDVFAELPLIISQVVFFYTLDALLTWSRGRPWRVGFGPLPIVISTNLLLWFQHDWYFFQFMMLTIGALGKQFITWQRDGRRTHIFNPSAFGQFVFAVVLIATGTTDDLTVGRAIAANFETPHMLLVLFLGGLIVQALFHVTLMTVAATISIVALSEAYTAMTGMYYFVNISILAPIFLGLHLLITDPATSPRSNAGRVLFGVLYGIGYFILFRLLDLVDVPLFWDKLLPVPILNLCVPLIDRFMRIGMLGRINHVWETALTPAKTNLIHMACWIAFFSTLWATGYIMGPHPGNSIPFWKQAVADNKMHAGRGLVIVAGSQAEGSNSGAAYNELGLICMEGKIIEQNRSLAAHYFAEGCARQDESGCVNVTLQFIVFGEARSSEDVALALDSLEQDCLDGGNSRSCFLAGYGYESGRGRPRDRQRAIELYERAGPDNLYAIKGLARISLSQDPPYDIRGAVPVLARAMEAGDVEACWYLAHMYRAGIGLVHDEQRARTLFARACILGDEQACGASQQPILPPYTNPVMDIPGWATAFPID